MGNLNKIYRSDGKIFTKKIFLKIYEKLLKILLIMQFIQIMKKIFLKEIMMYMLEGKQKILKIILKIFWWIGKNLKFLSLNILHQNQFLMLGKLFGKTKVLIVLTLMILKSIMRKENLEFTFL